MLETSQRSLRKRYKPWVLSIWSLEVVPATICLL
ncbi:hypothetical protein GBAR_LOCUS7266 [Geodia barretti]|uniref:Uncharacterized protein n=1 Tax=Geodia barretti TaxID=519541 RepID=A0AA35RHP2_GEOBA|nr:hypothetical protein GBAR_LOCUS7266 [Geodia barretti]